MRRLVNADARARCEATTVAWSPCCRGQIGAGHLFSWHLGCLGQHRCGLFDWCFWSEERLRLNRLLRNGAARLSSPAGCAVIPRGATKSLQRRPPLRFGPPVRKRSPSTFRPPSSRNGVELETLRSRRNYHGHHKHVVAVSGQTVCRKGLTISADGTEVGTALKRDRAGRDLPVWQGCRPIPVGAVFLMNSQVRDSFDGRYFGLLPIDHIVGRAVHLWTDEQGDGRFQWRASAR
ncbi:S26 family signal peptidase [Mesorhizobium sp. M4B.F.Ca.ET.143.01.1.1]|nr:S26 family signal peptidase [Mesorhizobium sp. M4B.F.Ca.ET.049.02.1.2]TGV24545.1 S26 family signal peptidase [Mesorhizobium sp. M4B.F.Ca.ET.143.01.1.1]